MGQGVSRFLFCLYRKPIPRLWMAATHHHSNYPWWKTKNHWRCVDSHFAMGVSTICYHVIWHGIALSVFLQPLYCLHILSNSSMHCSLVIYTNISYKLYFKGPRNVDNDSLKYPVPFHCCSSSLSGSLNWLLLSGQWMSAALPHSR